MSGLKIAINEEVEKGKEYLNSFKIDVIKFLISVEDYLTDNNIPIERYYATDKYYIIQAYISKNYISEIKKFKETFKDNLFISTYIPLYLTECFYNGIIAVQLYNIFYPYQNNKYEIDKYYYKSRFDGIKLYNVTESNNDNLNQNQIDSNEVSDNKSITEILHVKDKLYVHPKYSINAILRRLYSLEYYSDCDKNLNLLIDNLQYWENMNNIFQKNIFNKQVNINNEQIQIKKNIKKLLKDNIYFIDDNETDYYMIGIINPIGCHKEYIERKINCKPNSIINCAELNKQKITEYKDLSQSFLSELYKLDINDETDEIYKILKKEYGNIETLILKGKILYDIRLISKTYKIKGYPLLKIYYNPYYELIPIYKLNNTEPRLHIYVQLRILLSEYLIYELLDISGEKNTYTRVMKEYKRAIIVRKLLKFISKILLHKSYNISNDIKKEVPINELNDISQEFMKIKNDGKSPQSSNLAKCTEICYVPLAECSFIGIDYPIKTYLRELHIQYILDKKNKK